MAVISRVLVSVNNRNPRCRQCRLIPITYGISTRVGPLGISRVVYSTLCNSHLIVSAATAYTRLRNERESDEFFLLNTITFNDPSLLWSLSSTSAARSYTSCILARYIARTLTSQGGVTGIYIMPELTIIAYSKIHRCEQQYTLSTTKLSLE